VDRPHPLTQRGFSHVQGRMPFAAQQSRREEGSIAGPWDQENRTAVVDNDGGVRDRAGPLPNGLGDGNDQFDFGLRRPCGLNGTTHVDCTSAGLTVDR
jgi:hypothetical protein